MNALRCLHLITQSWGAGRRMIGSARLRWVCAALLAFIILPRAEAESLVGLDRAAVIQRLGQPQSELQRGDREILIYPNQLRVTLFDGQVIEATESPVIGAVTFTHTGSKGRHSDTAWSPPVRPSIPVAGKNAPASVKAASKAVALAPENEPEAAKAAALSPAGAAGSELNAHDIAVAADPTLALSPELQAQTKALTAAAANSEAAPATEESRSQWKSSLGWVVGVALRFAIALIALRFALAWVDLPAAWGDLVRVALAFVVVRESLHLLGGLEGYWQMIRLFRVDDAIGFIALGILLFRCRIVLTGITALKLAAMTSVAVYVTMSALGMAAAFGFLPIA